MNRSFKQVLSIVALTAVGGFVGAGIFKLTEKPRLSNPADRANNVQLANFAVTPPEAAIDFTKAAEMSVHAVVHIKTAYENKQANNPFYGADPFSQFFGGQPFRQQQQPIMGAGSGVIITDDGYIATNNHVVDNADKVEVTLNDKRTYTAKVIGTDPATDLALLKIDEKNLPTIAYGNSDVVKVGEWVLAVGNPFNLTSTVTAGIVSAKGRNINIVNEEGQRNPYQIESFIQTDAAVNRGNSGGALVNTRGELIGINAAIASTTGVYAGYSFAIPVNIVKKVMTDLLEFGEVQRALIGVTIQDVDAKIAEDKGLKDIKGVLVNGISNGGSAELSGIKLGDVITKVGDMPVNSSSELQEQVSRYRPGDKVLIAVVRDGKEKVFNVMLKNKSGTTDVVKNSMVSIYGAEFENLNKDEANKLGVNGVKIKQLNGGKLRSLGVREGFIITAIDNRVVKTTDELIALLQNKKGGVLIEGVYPNGVRAYYGLGL